MDHEMTWRKSSYSGGDNGNCVEVAHTFDAVWLRDSKNPGVTLPATPTALAMMLRSVGR